MPAQPNPAADPYRTLGLEPGASMAEVKRAYRRLAKAFHPDSAGESALPRFLAINAAYEQLKTGRVPVTGRAAKASSAAPAGEPWRADPARARAARERARTAKGNASGTSGAPGKSGPSGTSGASGTAAGGGRARSGPAQTGSSSTRSSTGGSTRSGRRSTRKATMGSTSYDEARDPADASWSGASWYGPSSGEYWIVNPREYADPRKHGPDYQQRARRLAESEQSEAAAAASSTMGVDADAATERPAATGTDDTYQAAWAAATSRPTAWTTATGVRRPGEAAPESREAAPTPGEGVPPIDRIEAASRAWLGGPADDPIRRLGLALVAWPPIGLAAASAIGEATGCSVFSAACGGSEPLLPWLAQPVILGLLLLLARISRVLAGGSIAILLALVPITAFLIAVGGSGAPQAGPVLGFLLGLAWLIGVAWSVRVSLAGGRTSVST